MHLEKDAFGDNHATHIEVLYDLTKI